MTRDNTPSIPEAKHDTITENKTPDSEITEEITESEWRRLAANNILFAFLHDADEDIYKKKNRIPPE